MNGEPQIMDEHGKELLGPALDVGRMQGGNDGERRTFHAGYPGVTCGCVDAGRGNPAAYHANRPLAGRTLKLRQGAGGYGPESQDDARNPAAHERIVIMQAGLDSLALVAFAIQLVT